MPQREGGKSVSFQKVSLRVLLCHQKWDVWQSTNKGMEELVLISFSSCRPTGKGLQNLLGYFCLDIFKVSWLGLQVTAE